ncbi:hypothetical protein SAMN05443529_10254 [Desulfosporosinus hippei DSM 8344]|uniref:Uncharacterized protein n=1 Tax=Desulfosporosinus hippei DSM 8344 TaxID=1121419 RepID=A0A1G7T169_9FIRM|nr:hypothetical protein SAMN05443529_10254 [Desulfosporosinus hippei DSM 8344]
MGLRLLISHIEIRLGSPDYKQELLRESSHLRTTLFLFGNVKTLYGGVIKAYCEVIEHRLNCYSFF